MLAKPKTPHITPDQISAYEKDGVVCLRGVISPGELEKLRSDVAAQMGTLSKSHTAYDFQALARQAWSNEDAIDAGDAGRFETAMLDMILDLDETARPIVEDDMELNDAGQFFYDAAGWRFHAGIRDVALDSDLPLACAHLLNTSYLNFWEDTTFVKAPNTAQKTTFHQDFGYFQIEGEKCCIVWIPLDPVDSENGNMQYIRGSHLWGESYAPNLLFSQSTHPMSPFEKLPDIEANSDNYDIISFDVQPGDVIIHHVMTVHGSSGNKSKDRFRRAISFRYCGDDVSYFDRPGSAVQPYLQEPLEDGERLYSKDYPLVWPRPYPGVKLAPLFADTVPISNSGEQPEIRRF